MPRKILVRLGLAFLFVAVTIYSFTSHWLNSRIFTPLDYPVSLESRQIKSPPFQINLRETYFVSLHLDDSSDDWYQDGRCNYKNVLGSEWQVYRLNSKSGEQRELWANSDEMTRRYYYYLGGFTATSGQYELEWTLPTSATCLDHRHPRLMVHTGSAGYEEGVAFIKICLIFFGGTGAVLVLLASARVVRNHLVTGGAPRVFPEMVLRNVLPITKRAPLPLIHHPPHWPLFFVAILSVLIFTFMIFGPVPSKGLFVTWKNRDAVVWEKSPWPDAPEVYVRAPARFFVNGQEVSQSDLRAKLVEQLSRRAEWTVYLEAEPDVAFMEAAHAMDTIQACGAELVWITPKMREDWQQKPKESEATTRKVEPIFRSVPD
jgi:biopolymer transport protein ExbD